jgi:hypothetical protein
MSVLDLLVLAVIVAALLVGGVYLWHVYRPARRPPTEGDLPASERPPASPPRTPRTPPPGAPMGP